MNLTQQLDNAAIIEIEQIECMLDSIDKAFEILPHSEDLEE